MHTFLNEVYVTCREHEARDALVYSYRYGFSGFAALLNSTQATTLAGENLTVSQTLPTTI